MAPRERLSVVDRSTTAATPAEKFRALAYQMWRRRWLAVGVSWCFTVACVIAIDRVPNRYEATARIYIDTQTVLKPLMAGLAFQPDVDQQVRMLARTLVSRPNVERLRADERIGWASASPDAVRRDADALMSKIKVEPQSGGTNVYLISYQDENPQRARRLVEALVDTFSSASSADKRKDSEDARKFIETEIRSYEGKLAAAENALKNFKLKNFGFSGVPAQDYFARVSSLSDDVSRLRLELGAAEQSRDAFRRELATEPQQLPVEALAGGSQPTSELDLRLEAQRRQLDDLLRRFTDAHPDVQSARRVLASMENQKKAEIEARQRAEAKGGLPAAATNPVYQRIRGSLADAEANVASLRGRLGAQEARLEQVRALANRVPQVEAELSQLNRDYDIIRKNYEQLVARRESATLGEKLDHSTNLAEFRIIDPPRTAERPKFPDRMTLALIAAIASIAAGLAAAVASGQLRPLVDDVTALAKLSGRPVLGTISLVLDASGLRRQRYGLMGLATALVTLFVVQGSWLVWVAVHSSLSVVLK